VILNAPSPSKGRTTDFWRIEAEDGAVVVHTYKIDPVNEVHTETGRWTEYVETGEPFPLTLPIARLTPRHLSSAAISVEGDPDGRGQHELAQRHRHQHQPAEPLQLVFA
jgi:hypothetical protein